MGAAWTQHGTRHGRNVVNVAGRPFNRPHREKNNIIESVVVCDFLAKMVRRPGPGMCQHGAGHASLPARPRRENFR